MSVHFATLHPGAPPWSSTRSHPRSGRTCRKRAVRPISKKPGRVRLLRGCEPPSSPGLHRFVVLPSQGNRRGPHRAGSMQPGPSTPAGSLFTADHYQQELDAISSRWGMAARAGVASLACGIGDTARSMPRIGCGCGPFGARVPPVTVWVAQPCCACKCATGTHDHESRAGTS